MTRQNEPAEQVGGRPGRRLAESLLERAEQHLQVDWVEPAAILLAAF
jgi:FlaA1/EpsC-like NDP-sugar epimerase